MNPESLKWKDWDMITGGLECFLEHEWTMIERGCECNIECDSNKAVGCYDETTIDMLRKLQSKIESIKKTLWASEMGLKR